MSPELVATVTTLARRHRTGPGTILRPRRCSCGERLTGGVCHTFITALVAAFAAARVPARNERTSSNG